jgi:hypothetical protein
MDLFGVDGQQHQGRCLDKAFAQCGVAVQLGLYHVDMPPESRGDRRIVIGCRVTMLKTGVQPAQPAPGGPPGGTIPNAHAQQILLDGHDSAAAQTYFVRPPSAHTG